MRTSPVVALALLAGAVLPAVASGATTIGDASKATGTASVNGITVTQLAPGGVQPLVVPDGGGVITAVSARAYVVQGVRPQTGRVVVLRGATPTFTVAGSADLTLYGSSPQLETAPARIPVQGGERLGFSAAPPSSTQVALGIFGSPGALISSAGSSALPPDGASLTFQGGTSDQALSLAATLEPDADHDGYGDETQDSCPTLAGVHAGSCAAALSTTAAAAPRSVAQGDVTTITATVTDAGPTTAYGATATLTVPAGLQVVAASTTGGSCTGTTCALGDVPVGSSRQVVVVVRGTAVGAQALRFAASAVNPGAQPAAASADETVDVTPAPAPATTTVTVTAPAPAVAPVTTTVTAPALPAVTVAVPAPAATTTPTAPAPAVRLCVVPSLRGRTASAARSALTRAGCRAGTVTGSRRRTARVTTQAVPARTSVLAGTRVGFRLAAGRR